MAAVFLLDATFVGDTSKFLSGSLLSLSAMIAMELPHTNVLTKCDLLTEEEVEDILDFGSATQMWDQEQDRQSLIMPTPFNVHTIINPDDEVTDEQRRLERRRRHRQRLTDSISQLLDDYSMISFMPLNIRDEESIDTLLTCVDASIQYGEDLEVREYDGPEGNDD
mmetsp:Transcript_34234/g.80650  ORF Transcript_34234/g.80650 Transcript_34234/m.80650 type:complete len:166 (+) Transcript_34234:1-498(+)